MNFAVKSVLKRISCTQIIEFPDFQRVFVWSGHVHEDKNNKLTMHTVFDYQDIQTGESLWIVEIDERVDKMTRKYLDKEGYYMFPRNLPQEDIKVYDVGGAVMDYKFVGVTAIDDLTVYEFTGTTTFDISDVYPDFEEQIFEEYTAINFIEPTTGIEVSFTEQFTDYAIVDDQRVVILDASDNPSEFSQKVHIQKAKSLKALHDFYTEVIPIVIIVSIASIAIITLLQSKFKQSKEKVVYLEEKEKIKDEFASMISHELKTPLVPIKLHCDMLLENNYGELTEKQKDTILSISHNSDFLQFLIDDILDAQKLELGKLQIFPEKIDVKKMIEKNIEILKSYTKDTNILLTSNINTSGIIFADPKRISQVILNLVKNSVDFVPEKDGKITISVDKKVTDIVFTVTDNGSGIDPEKKDRLFQKFYQVSPSKKRKHGGTGLGLSICNGIIQAHKGKIWLDTEYASGASFKFTIPEDK